MSDPVSAYQSLQKNIPKGIGITAGLREQMDCVSLWIGYRIAQSNLSTDEYDNILSTLLMLAHYCETQQSVILTTEEMRFLLLPLLFQNGSRDMTMLLNTVRSISNKGGVALI